MVFVGILFQRWTSFWATTISTTAPPQWLEKFPDKPAPGGALRSGQEGGKDTHRYLISSSNGFSAEIHWGFLPAKVYRRLKDLFGQGRRPSKARSPPTPHHLLPRPFAQLLHKFLHLAARLQFMCVRTPPLYIHTGYTQMCVWLGYVWWGVILRILCSSRHSRYLENAFSFLVLFKPLECPLRGICCLLSFIKSLTKTTWRKIGTFFGPRNIGTFTYFCHFAMFLNMLKNIIK